MHSCGNNRAILERLLQAGVKCFQFDQPAIYDFADLSSLLKKYNGAIWSPVDIQKILPTGNKQLIESEVKRMREFFDGHLVYCNYGDLQGIGVNPQWDQWAYEAMIQSI